MKKSNKPNKLLVVKDIKFKLPSAKAETSGVNLREEIRENLLPISLSPSRNYNEIHKKFKKNPTEKEREFDVSVFWDFENLPLPKSYDHNLLLSKITTALRTLRKEYVVKSFWGFGESKRHFDEKQLASLGKQNIKIYDVPKVDRQSAAVKQNSAQHLLAQYFLSQNPSVLDPLAGHQYQDAFLTDPAQQHLAKYFMALYFQAQYPSLLAQPASAHHNPAYTGSSPHDPAQHHMAQYYYAQNHGWAQNPIGIAQHHLAQDPIGLAQHNLAQNPIGSSSDDPAPGYQGKTDMADFVLMQDMLLEAMDSGPPGNILVITGDVDFARPMLALKDRGFCLLLAKKKNSNEKLIEASTAGWNWTGLREEEKYDFVNLEDKGQKYFKD